MSGLRLLTGPTVDGLLADRERELVAAVRAAYIAHATGRTAVPHSTFLRFPGRASDRIIALPAYLGGEGDADGEVAGIKWVSSFPGNVAAGLERASAVIVLNSLADGRPTSIVEGSVINAKRTAASAVLAALVLRAGDRPMRVGAVGCGRIQFELLRFLLRAGPPVESIALLDLDAGRAARLAEAVTGMGVACRVAGELDDLLRASDLVAFATTAQVPYVADLGRCPPGATVLHVSLRDLKVGAIAACDNVADDVDHVCRADTSLDLAVRELGHREFIRCAIGDILVGNQPPRLADDRPVVFSPFGLGILDLAAARLAVGLAEQAGAGMEISGFQPPAWSPGGAE